MGFAVDTMTDHELMKCLETAPTSEEILAELGQISPGGAGRIRTLGLKKLEQITVPIPPLDKQREFKRLIDLRTAITQTAAFHPPPSATALLVTI